MTVEAVTSQHKGRPRVPLSRRYAQQVGAISVLLLSCAGMVEGVFGYRQARAQMASLQAVHAQAAAREIEQYLDAVAQALRQVQALPWGGPDFGPQRRREELHRLLSLNPSLVSLKDVDEQGAELMFVSRKELDRVESRRPSALQPLIAQQAYSSAQFDEQGVPNVTLLSRLKPMRGEGGQTQAVVDLRFLADVVSGLRQADQGQVYVVDSTAQLLAHPDPTLILKQLSLAKHGQYLAARKAIAAGRPLLEAIDGMGLQGGASIITGVPMREPASWLLFVEQPRAQALAPALATLERTLVLLVVGGAIALLVSLAWARRVAAPIARLREATGELAAGQLGRQLQVHSGDEIEMLARDFNAMAAQIEQSYRVLEDKVAERTAELTESRDQAEQTSARLRRFLRVVGHDLREPLHTIGLQVGTLREARTDPQTLVLAEQLQGSVRAMDDLFRGLLQFGNLEAGAVTPRPTLFRLQEMLDGMRNAYAPLALNKGLEFRVRSTGESVYTDPTLLHQILGNLCTNAIRYTQRGGMLLACRRRGDFVAVQVYDTGVGIEKQYLGVIFEDFVRLRQTADAEEGTGTGLNIVKSSAELLGLGFGVVSRPGRGSRFEVVLPAVSSDPASADTQDDVTDLTGAFVLLIDDLDPQRHSTALLLRQWGCLVAMASSGSALVELARHLRAPDVIVLFDRTVPTSNTVQPGEVAGFTLVQGLRDAIGEFVPALVVASDANELQGSDDDIRVIRMPNEQGQLKAALSAILPLRPGEYDR